MGVRPTIFLAAGEPSGDLHGAAVAGALLRRWPGARLLGLAGPRMQAAGVEPIVEFDRLAVMGFVEVLRHLPFFTGLLRRSVRALDEEDVDLVLPIDYPGFNLRLAQRASAAVLAVCVLVHLATIIYAVRGGLSAAEILARTSGSAGWAIFYGAFVLAVAVHGPIGLRNVLSETLDWRGRSLDYAMLALGVILALWGLRAVYAVTAA